MDKVIKSYGGLPESGVLRDGTFDSSIWDLIYELIPADREIKLGEYTVVEGERTDTMKLTTRVTSDEG